MKQWGEPRKLNKVLQPELLGQANIPKALHGINPRTIMGQSAWSRHRQEIIQNHPYCAACGLETMALDLHEDYTIDYNKSIMKLKKYVPLCKDCHAFIHSGLLKVRLVERDISRQKAVDILQKGLHICSENNIPVFIVGYNLAKTLSIDVSKNKCWSPSTNSWGNWYLEYNGQRYKGMSYAQWKNTYQRKGFS